MTVDWLKFSIALVLLLTPGDLFNGRKVRYREISRHWEGYWARTLTHGLHAIDLMRATVGTWMLLDSLHGALHPAGFARYAVVMTQGLVRIVAVAVQTVVCREHESGNAPFAFVVGTLLGGFSPVAGAFAVALALPVALGTRAPAVFFLVAALTHMAVGFWFEGKSAVLSLTFGAIAAVLPFFWSLMFRRELVVPYRLKRAAPDEKPSRLR